MPKQRGFNSKRIDVSEALKLGWVYDGHSGTGHLQFRHPGSKVRLKLPCSPSEYRGLRNAITRIRKMTPPRED
jgi:hypothetical protein